MFGFGGLTLGLRNNGCCSSGFGNFSLGLGPLSIGLGGGYGCHGGFGSLTLGLNSIFSACGLGGYGGSFGLGGFGSGLNMNFGNYGGHNFFNMGSYSSMPGFSSYSNFGTSPWGSYSNFGLNSGFFGFGPSAGFNMGYNNWGGFNSFGMNSWNSFGPLNLYNNFYTSSYNVPSYETYKPKDTPQKEVVPQEENVITKFYEADGSKDMQRYIDGAKNLANVEMSPFDANSDGKLTEEEFVQGQYSRLESKMKNDTSVQYEAPSKQQIEEAKQEFKNTFNALDINKDNFIDEKEYANYLSYSDALDDKHDGKISSLKQSALFSALADSESENAKIHRNGLTNWYSQLFPDED